MGIYHFSGLFVLLCLGLGSALLSSLGEHIFYYLVLPCIRRGNRLQYWLHTSQVRRQHRAGKHGQPPNLTQHSLYLAHRESTSPSTQSRWTSRKNLNQGKGLPLQLLHPPQACHLTPAGPTPI